MTTQQFSTIDRHDLEQRIATHSLNNQDRHRGVTLVNVLGEGAFEMARIPGSINIRTVMKMYSSGALRRTRRSSSTARLPIATPRTTSRQRW